MTTLPLSVLTLWLAIQKEAIRTIKSQNVSADFEICGNGKAQSSVRHTTFLGFCTLYWHFFSILVKQKHWALNFPKIQVPLKLFLWIFLTLQKVASWHANQNSIIKKWGSMCLFSGYKHSKLNLGVFLTGHTVAMVTSNVEKVMTTCSPMIGHLFNTLL